MIQTLTRNWWLLALCGVLDAMISAVYFSMQTTDGPLTFHTWSRTVVLVGKLALAAGACTIAAGTFRSTRGTCWLLVVNGFALCALGMIQYDLTRMRISFVTVALLIILMAVSIGILELLIARTLRHQRHFAGACLVALAGLASFSFALAFLSLGLRWIEMKPGSHLDLLLLGSYFGLTAISKLGLALRLHFLVLSGPAGKPIENASVA